MLEWHGALQALCEEADAVFNDHSRTRQSIFLAAYVECFDTTASADASGVSIGTVRAHWMNDGPFRTCYNDAQEQIKERIGGEIYRRAVKGVEKGVWHQGKLVGMETQYSDRLLEMLAKRVDPAWSDRQQAAKIGVGSESSAAIRRILANPELRAQAMALAEAADQSIDIVEAEIVPNS